MLTIRELVDIVMMSLGLGYIFMDLIKPYHHHYDPLAPKGATAEKFKFALFVTAPAIILHEMAHKFTAIYFGIDATFYAAYTFLGLAIILKLVNFPFLFFVPGYVSIAPGATPLQMAAIAFAGPLVHAIFYLVAIQQLKKKPKNVTTIYFWELTKRINGFLFILNMLPIWVFDGQKVLSGLMQHFFG